MIYITEKQKRFCDEYIISGNATDAAIKAGYSQKTAYSQGQRILKNVEVKMYIDKQLSQIHSSAVADAQEVMEYLTAVMRGKSLSSVLSLCGDGCQEVIQKLPDEKEKIKAAELIGKRYGLFNNKVEIESNTPVFIVGDDMIEE